MRLRMLPLFVAGFAAAQVAFSATVPPLVGQVSGAFVPTLLPGAPAMSWKVELQPAAPAVTRLRVTAAGEGIRLAAWFDLEAGNDDGTWRVDEVVVDAARWLPALRPRLGAPAADLAASGDVVLSGSGRLRDGVPSGSVRVVWRGGSVRNEKAGWRLEGIEFDGEFAFDHGTGSLSATRSATLTLGTITTGRFGARNLSVSGWLKDRRTFALDAARIEIAGGDVTAAPATLSLDPVAVELGLELRRVGLQDVAALVPQAVAEARGRIDGNLVVRWTDAQGFDVGNGKLVLRHDEPATVRLNPAPGLITSALPWFILKLYPGLREVERGELPIAAEELEVTLTPKGDAQGRTAVVHLAGGPTDPRKRAPIDLNVNVRAPLKTLIDFGTTKGTTFKW